MSPWWLVLVEVLVGWLFASALMVVAWARLMRRPGLDEAIERHPACGHDDPDSYRFTFRARPCQHRLFCSTLDPIDLEHVELLHVQFCPVALTMIGREVA